MRMKGRENLADQVSDLVMQLVVLSVENAEFLIVHDMVNIESCPVLIIYV